jgi:hypothetical protein
MPDYACPQDWVYRYIANHASVWIDLYTEPLPRVEVFLFPKSRRKLWIIPRSLKCLQMNLSWEAEEDGKFRTATSDPIVEGL